MLATAKGDALLHLRQQRVGHDAAQLNIADAGVVEQAINLVKQTRTACRAATVVDEYTSGTIGLEQLRQLLFRLAAEHHTRRSIEIEVFYHNAICFFLRILSK